VSSQRASRRPSSSAPTPIQVRRLLPTQKRLFIDRTMVCRRRSAPSEDPRGRRRPEWVRYRYRAMGALSGRAEGPEHVRCSLPRGGARARVPTNGSLLDGGTPSILTCPYDEFGLSACTSRVIPVAADLAGPPQIGGRSDGVRAVASDGTSIYATYTGVEYFYADGGGPNEAVVVNAMIWAAIAVQAASWEPSAKGASLMSDKSNPEPHWLPPAANPFGVELLDLHGFVANVTAWSPDPNAARNAMGWRGDDGLEFVGAPLPRARRVSCQLGYTRSGGSVDGRWFCPGAMEDKWALFHYEARLYAVRSWTRQVAMVGHTVQHENEVNFTGIDVGELGPRESDEEIVRGFDFLVKSHVLGALVPAPIGAAVPRDADLIAKQCFNSWGRRALGAAYADLRAVPVNRPVISDTPLMIAIEARDTRRALAWIDDARTTDLDVTCRYGSYTSLHSAAVKGLVEVVASLLAHGARVNSLAHTKRTALHEIVTLPKANMAVVRLLLDAGASVRARDEHGAEPIHLAAQTGSAEVVRVLLEAGADPNAKTDHGFAPLHQAAEAGRLDIVMNLLSAGAEMEVSVGDLTPLKLAQTRGQRAMVDLLRSRGATK
jgi:hypothetical protein